MLCGLLLSVSAYAQPDWYTRANFTVKVGETLPDGSFNNEPRWTFDATTQREVIVASSDANAGDTWDCQLFVQLPAPLNEGDKVTIRMKVRADNVQGACGSILNAEPGVYVDWHGMDSIYFASKWTDYVGTIEITDNMLSYGMQPQTIAFLLTEPYTANNFYFDQISVAVDKAPAVDDWYKHANFTMKVGYREVDGSLILEDLEPVFDYSDGNAYFRTQVPACVKSRDERMLYITLPEPAEEGDVVSLKMKLRADANISNAYVETHHMPGEPITWITDGGVDLLPWWTYYDKTWIVGKNLLQPQSTVSQPMASSMQTFGIALAEYNMNEMYVYVDEVYVTLKKHHWTNIIINSDMEDFDQMDGYLMKEGANGSFVPATNQKGSAIVHAEASVNAWDSQFIVKLPYTIPLGIDYKFSFKSVASESVQNGSASAFNDKMYWNGVMTGNISFSNTVWSPFEIAGTTKQEQVGGDNSGMRNIALYLAQLDADVDFMFDDVVFEIDESMIEPLRNRTEMIDLIKEAETAIREGKVPSGSEQLTTLQGAIQWGEGLLDNTDYEGKKWSYAWVVQEIRRALSELEQQQQQPTPVDDPAFKPGEADQWYTNANFTIKVDDTPKGGTRQFIAEPRWVKDPLDKKFENNVIVVTTPENAQATWESQIFFTAPAPFEIGDKVTLRMKVRADIPRNDVQSHTHGQPGEYRHWMFFNEPVIFTTEWRTFEATAEVKEELIQGGQTVALMLAEVDGESNNFFFDDVELIVTKVPATEDEAKNQLAKLIDRVSSLDMKYKPERLKKELIAAIKAAQLQQKRKGLKVALSLKPYRDIMSVLEKAALKLKRFADTNTDGHVSVTDAIALIKHIVDKDPEGFSLLGADVNDDGKFTITDAIAILRLILEENEGTSSSSDLEILRPGRLKLEGKGGVSAPARPDMDEVDNGRIPQ